MRLLLALSVVLACLIAPVSASAQQRAAGVPNYNVTYVAPPNAVPAWAWGGGGVTNSWEGGYAGGIAALNGNLSSNTLLFRAEGLLGSYDSNLISPGSSPNFDVDMNNWGLSGGYRVSTGRGWLSGYVGYWEETHNNNRDPNAELRGTERGVKGIVDLWQPLSPKWVLVAYGSYADAWQTWSGYGRVTYQLTDRIRIGPETSFFGNVAYEDGKVGGFLSYSPKFLGYGEIAVAGGYRHPYTDSPDGYYLNAYLSFPIRY
jgi:hypothetical protein